MVLFLLGVIVSMLWSRLYCGWACPMHTVMRCITWGKRKLRVKGVRTPAFVRKPAVRVAFMVIFIAAFAFVMVSGRQIPVLPILLGLSAVIALLWNESMWHRYLCPQGAILSITGRTGKKGLSVGESCIGCGVCAQTCPAEAITKKGAYTIQRHECIQCGQCEAVCKVKAIEKGGKDHD